jgi:hypothetical protein
MDDLEKNGEVEKPIVESGLKLEEVKAMIEAAREEDRKKYQSKIDQILAEKREVESKKMTVEEQIAAMQEELKRERAAAIRGKAKSIGGIDDDFENAILDYSDPAKAVEAAQKIKALRDAEKKAYMDQIEELQKKLQFGAKVPHGGSPGGVDFSKMSFDELNDYAMRGPEFTEAVLAHRKKK